jgi:hypothetical protein
MLKWFHTKNAAYTVGSIWNISVSSVASWLNTFVETAIIIVNLAMQTMPKYNPRLVGASKCVLSKVFILQMELNTTMAVECVGLTKKPRPMSNLNC